MDLILFRLYPLLLYCNSITSLLSVLCTFFDDFIMSLGPEAIILNNRSIFKDIFYLPVLHKINGIPWKELKNRNEKPIEDSDLLNIIPEKYIKDA